MRVFRRWLLRFESGRGSNSGSLSNVYHEYTAARVMRLLLREIQLTNPTAVFAGSFPAWQFLESIKEDTWQPRDIDIFLFDDIAMERAMDLYVTIVSDSMRVACSSKLWRHSDTTQDDTHAEDDINSLTGVHHSMIEIQEVMRTLHAWLLDFPVA